jgi:tetratricopeptide (TPR) repeat protein
MSDGADEESAFDRISRLLSDEQFDEAELLAKHYLEKSVQQHGEEHSDTAHNIENLAYVYFKQQRYDDAERLLKQALVIRETVNGPEDPETGDIFNDLGNVYAAQELSDQAEVLFLRALAIREKANAVENRDGVIILENLANVYRDQGEYYAAEDVYRRLVMISKMLNGPDHPATGSYLNKLAVVLLDRQDAFRLLEEDEFEEIKAILTEALAIREQADGGNDIATANTLFGLAILYRKAGRPDEAVLFQQRATRIRRGCA